MNMNALVLAAALGAVSASASQAAIVMNIWEDGSDVRAQVRGSLDLSGADEVYLVYGSSFQSGDTFLLGRDDEDTFYLDAYQYNYDAGPSSIGEVTFNSPAVSSGTDFGMIFGEATSGSATAIYVSQDFVSGGAISSDTLFTATNLATMKLYTGSYLFSLPLDTITINVGTAPTIGEVPLPASGLLLAAGSGLMAWAGRRRRQA